MSLQCQWNLRDQQYLICFRKKYIQGVCNWNNIHRLSPFLFSQVLVSLCYTNVC